MPARSLVAGHVSVRVEWCPERSIVSERVEGHPLMAGRSLDSRQVEWCPERP